MSLKGLLEKQKHDRFRIVEEGEYQEQLPMIAFCFGKDCYCLEIEDVVELVENQKIKTYPVPVDGHAGVVNVRGKVFTVIALNQEIKDDYKLMILHDEDGEAFCIPVNNVQKFLAPTAEGLGNVLSFNGKPVIKTTPREILDRSAEVRHVS